VLTAGGVCRIALAGSVAQLAAAGYTFSGLAGSSSGAIAGALTAALVHAGEPPGRLAEMARTLHYRRFRDPGIFGRFLGWPGDALDLVLYDGLFRGDYLERWLSGVRISVAAVRWRSHVLAPLLACWGRSACRRRAG
jgi:NTE family protein